MLEFDRSSDSRIIRRVAQVASGVLGITTLLAWHLQIPFLLRWNLLSPPLHYNSAIVFVLIAILLGPLPERHKSFGSVLAAFIVGLNSATLSEYFFYLDFGIDQFVVADLLTPATLAPGRISPNSCVCGILVAIASLIRIHAPISRWRSFALQTLGSSVFALGITAILGYIGGISAAYSWGNLTHMPIQSAVCFAIVGKATTLDGWISNPKLRGFGRFSLGTPIALSVLAFAVALSHALISESKSSTGRSVEVLAKQLGESLQQNSRQSVTMVEDIAVEGLLSRKRDRIQHVLQSQMPSVTSVVGFDDRWNLHWLYVRQPNAERFMKSQTNLLQSVLTTFFVEGPHLETITQTSRPFQDPSGVWSLLVVFPHAKGSRFRNIALQLDLEKIVAESIAHVLPEGFYSRVLLDYEVVFEGSSSLDDGDIWTRGKDIDWGLQQEVPFSLMSAKGRVVVAPNRYWAKMNGTSYLPLVTLLGGVLFAILIASLGHLATAARAQQQEAEAANRRMQMEIDRRQNMETELRHAKEVADRANQSKSFFLANISHELRTPLGVVIGFGNLLRSKDWTRPEAEHLIDRILTNSSELTRIIDDLLDLTKAETGHLLIEESEFSLRDFFEDVEASLRLKASAKGVNLQFLQESLLPERIVTDRTRLRQILVNIIGNAIKFTDVGAVTVRVSRRMTKDATHETLRIAVQDSGVGLGDEQRDSIFRAFGQADRSLSNRVGGTGLGLLLSRQLARFLNGDVTLEQSAPGVGSLFLITINYAKCEPSTGVDNLLSTPAPSSVAIRPRGILSVKNPEKANLGGIQILVAEDAKDNQFLLQKILTSVGGVVTIAEDGQKALQRLSESQYDIILMDLQMPVLDGYQTVAFLRQKGIAVPVIALTAHAMREEKERCLKAGFNAYLTKPIQFDILVQTIKRFALVPTATTEHSQRLPHSETWAEI